MDYEILKDVYEQISEEEKNQEEKRMIYISTLITNPFIFKDELLNLMSLNEKQILELEQKNIIELKNNLYKLMTNPNMLDDFNFVMNLSDDIKCQTDNLVMQLDISDLFQTAVAFKTVPDDYVVLSRTMLGDEYNKCLTARAVYEQMLKESTQKFNIIKENSKKTLIKKL